MFNKRVVSSVLIVLAVFALDSAAFAADTIGVIDSQRALSQHPKYEEITKQLQQISDTKKNEALAAIEQETDDEKRMQIMQTKQMEMAREEQRLMVPIQKECTDAIRVVAKKKKVTLVLEKISVYFGGLDITDDVVQQLKIDSAKK